MRDGVRDGSCATGTVPDFVELAHGVPNHRQYACPVPGNPLDVVVALQAIGRRSAYTENMR